MKILRWLKLYNDSPVVAVVYGVALAGPLLAALAWVGLVSVARMDLLGVVFGGLILSLVVMVICATIPLGVGLITEPEQSDSPMNLWLPVMLTFTFALNLYMEHGEYGGQVKQFVFGLPNKVLGVVNPTYGEVIRLIEKNKTDGLKKNDGQCSR